VSDRPSRRRPPPRGGRAPTGRDRGPARGPSRGAKGRGRAAPPPRNRPGLGGDQVEGRHAVRELLVAGRRRVHEVWVATDGDDVMALAEIVDLARERRVRLQEVSRRRLEAEATSEAPQGVMARTAPLRPVDLEELLDSAGPAFLLVLDGLTDPGNLGALLRTAEAAGVTGVVLPRHRAVRITPTVAKAAAGAIEHLRFAAVGGIPNALAQLRERKVWVVGLDGQARAPLFGLEVAGEPVALVLGAEGRGLSRLVRERCDQLVSIPLRGEMESLNVAAAGALALYEIVRARE
jgi:23S rRNA (guanosine2251-2'-O)-methyltransferase